jgi:hypothetical protein
MFIIYRMMGLSNFLRSVSAVSEILGNVLLLSIVTILFTVVGYAVFNIFPSTTTPSIDILCQVRGNSIILTNRGGDALNLETKIGFSTFNGTTNYIVANDYLNTTEKQDGKWSVGENVIYSNTDVLESQIHVTVIDPSSTSVVFLATVPMIDSISVTTIDVTTITTNSANVVLQYNFQSHTGQVRFSYRSNAGSWTNTSWISKSGSGSYNLAVTGLTPATVYYFKAQLLYSSTILTGEQMTFTTLS